MKVDKIKAINRQIEETLKTNPNQFLKNRKNALKSPTSIRIPELQCSLCEDIKRQNYKLKQQIYQLQEKGQRQTQLQKQLIAMRELYELKCREIQLTNQQLLNYKEKVQNMKDKNHRFAETSIKTFQKLI